MTSERRARIADGSDPATPLEAARVLGHGGLVIFPTDTVYGVAASLECSDALGRLYVVKGRPLDRPIPVLVSDFAQVPWLTTAVDPRIERLLRRFWPGPLTVALPAAPWLPAEIVRDTGRVGLRMPAHPLALAIIAAAGGALATTSANRSGEREARTAAEADAALGERVDLIVDGGVVPGGRPSTVVVVDDGWLSIARPGPITAEDIRREAPDVRLLQGHEGI